MPRLPKVKGSGSPSPMGGTLISRINDARNPVCRGHLMKLHAAVDNALAVLRVPAAVGGRYGPSGSADWAETTMGMKRSASELDRPAVAPDRDSVLVELMQQAAVKVERLSAMHVAYQDSRGDMQGDVDRLRHRLHKREHQLKVATRGMQNLRRRLRKLEASGHHTGAAGGGDDSMAFVQPEPDERLDGNQQDDSALAADEAEMEQRNVILASVTDTVSETALSILASELANARGDADRMWLVCVNAMKRQVEEARAKHKRADEEKEMTMERCERLKSANAMFRAEIDKLRGELRSSQTRSRVEALEVIVEDQNETIAAQKELVVTLQEAEERAKGHSKALEADFQDALRRERELSAQIVAAQAEAAHRAELQAEAEKAATAAVNELRKSQGGAGAPQGDLRQAHDELVEASLENLAHLRASANRLTDTVASRLVDQLVTATLPKKDRSRYKDLQDPHNHDLQDRCKLLFSMLKHPRVNTISLAHIMAKFDELRPMDRTLLCVLAVSGICLPPKQAPPKAQVVYVERSTPPASPIDAARALGWTPPASPLSQRDSVQARHAQKTGEGEEAKTEEAEEEEKADVFEEDGEASEGLEEGDEEDEDETSVDSTPSSSVPPTPSGSRRSISQAHTVRKRTRRIAHHGKGHRDSGPPVDRFEVVLQVIGQLYETKIKIDATDDRAGMPRKTLRSHVNDWMERKYGLRKIAKEHLLSLEKAVGKYGSRSARVRVFGRFNLWKTCCPKLRCAHDEEEHPTSNALDMFLYVLHRIIPSKGFAEALGGSQCLATVKSVEKAMAETLFYIKLKPEAIALREWMASAAARTPADPTTKLPRVDLDEVMELMLPLFALEEEAASMAELQRSGVTSQVFLWPKLFASIQHRLEALPNYNGETDDPRIVGLLAQKLSQFDSDSDGKLVHSDFTALLLALGDSASSDHDYIAHFNQALDLEESFRKLPAGAALRSKIEKQEERDATTAAKTAAATSSGEAGEAGEAGGPAQSSAPASDHWNLVRNVATAIRTSHETEADHVDRDLYSSDDEEFLDDDLELRLDITTLAHALQHDFGSIAQPPRRRLSVLLGLEAPGTPKVSMGTPAAPGRSVLSHRGLAGGSGGSSSSSSRRATSHGRGSRAASRIGSRAGSRAGSRSGSRSGSRRGSASSSPPPRATADEALVRGLSSALAGLQQEDRSPPALSVRLSTRQGSSPARPILEE